MRAKHWAGATATVSVAMKWGRSSPPRCFARVQDPSLRRVQPLRPQQLPFTVGGERNGEPHSEPRLSCSVHPSTPEETIEIRCHRHTSTIKEASKTGKHKRKFWP